MNYDKIAEKAQLILESLDAKFPTLSGQDAKRGIDFAKKKMLDGSYSVEEFYAVQLAMMSKVEVTNYYKH